MAQVTVFGPNLGVTGEQMHVHAAGCADTKKPVYRRDGGWTIEAASPRSVVEDIYPPDDFDYDPETELNSYLSDIKFFPCVKF